MTVKTLSYHALNKGVSLAIIGAVHGNEKCGTQAIYRIIEDLETKKLLLKQGSLHLMPIANPQAYEQNVRFVERNLNRSLYPKKNKQHYEDHLDQNLCAFIDQANVLLDLHSYNSSGEPFLFLETSNTKEIAYAQALDIPNMVYGWSFAFGAGNAKESQGTTEYARLKGIVAVTVECGQHEDPHAPEIGYISILKSLHHLQMIDEQCECATHPALHQAPTPSRQQRYVKMQHVYYREEGDTLVKEWEHLDAVTKQEVIGHRKNGSPILAPDTGYIVLPKCNASTGSEWFYFGTATPLPNIPPQLINSIGL